MNAMTGTAITTRWAEIQLAELGSQINPHGELQADRWVLSIPLSHGYARLLTAASGAALLAELASLHEEGGEVTTRFDRAAFGCFGDEFWLDVEIQDVADSPRTFFESADRLRFDLEEILAATGTNSGHIAMPGDGRALGFFRQASAERYREEEM